MTHRRPVSISISLDLDASPSTSSSPKGVKRRSLPFPDGFKEIESRLLRRGEAKDYAKEHAARIWNDAHPEEPVETSFDGPDGGLIPNNGGKPTPQSPADDDTPKSKRRAPKPTKDTDKED